ncbi:MAG: plastocyanin/azurin family copper-binding protein [Verrucomicrobiota bacterium]
MTQSIPAQSVAETKAPPKPKARSVSLRMVEGLRFDPARFEASPGELIAMKLANMDSSHQPHNFVIVQPGQVQEVVKLSMEMAASGAAPGAVPKHPAVVASSADVVNPEGNTVVQFKVPDEPGVYGYVCTVPGHGMVMYGALYVGVPMPPLAKDTNIPQITLEKGLVGAGRRPFVQRFFMQNASPAAIGVALPGDQNYCFDSVECRVRYVWSGIFMDGSMYWRGSGKESGELGDVPWWTSGAFPLKFGAEEIKSKDFKFLGYTLKEQGPEFHFQVGKQEVFESVVPSGKGVELKFRLPEIHSEVQVRTDSEALWTCPQGVASKSGFRIPAAKAREFSVELQPKDVRPVAAEKSESRSGAQTASPLSNP